jgi:alpha-ketoglutarate-dependent taurine dioxygenase
LKFGIFPEALERPMSTTVKPVTVKPLSEALGAEIVGADLSRPLDDATIGAIKEAWKNHLILLFRDQALTEEDQVRFARYFGELQQRPRPKDLRAEAKVKNPEVMLVSNIRENGKLIGSLPDGEMQFHSDMCYISAPPKGTFLYAVEIPSQGGDTLFLNMYKAYDSLSPEIKKRLDGKTAVNVFLYGSTTRDGNRPDFNVHPHASHPMVRIHSDTGRPALYINRLMTWNIEDMDDGESRSLLDTLFDHIEQPQFIYAHKWRVGDLILWDNRCTLHARTDFSDKERRLLRRVVVQA